MSDRPLILHITGDYPDPTRAPTTVAVKQLIDSLTDCDHVVFSLTRTADPRRTRLVEVAAAPGQRVFALHHFGLPLGVGLRAAFDRVALRIEAVLGEQAIDPDLVHSHRLTFDGLAGRLVARRRGIAHFVSVRGEVESKVLRRKPSYRPMIRRMLDDAARIYFVSAWFRDELQQLAPDTRDKSRNLPNIVANTRRTIDPQPPRPRIISIANLDIYRKKGIDRLIQAFAMAAPRIGGVALDIVGGGKPEAVAALEHLIDAAGMSDRIHLLGAFDHARLLVELPGALAMALPSRNETFGMVYTEALFAGVPILYSRGTGIDGHLDGLDVGIAVDCDDVHAIAEGLVRLAAGNQHFRRSISAAAPVLFERFDRERQVAQYMADLGDALGRAPLGADRATSPSPVGPPRACRGAAGAE